MILDIIKAVKTLLAYLMCFLIVVNLPWFGVSEYITIGGIYLLAMLLVSKWVDYGFNIWYGLDVVVCSIVHGTRYRTISGICGQKMDKQKRYYYQAKIIDFIFKIIGDGPNHCKRAWEWEKNTLTEFQIKGK